jgi:hypothetical protein
VEEEEARVADTRGGSKSRGLVSPLCRHREQPEQQWFGIRVLTVRLHRHGGSPHHPPLHTRSTLRTSDVHAQLVESHTTDQLGPTWGCVEHTLPHLLRYYSLKCKVQNEATIIW